MLSIACQDKNNTSKLKNFSGASNIGQCLTWSWQPGKEDRDGLTRQQFARYYLMRLGIGHDLERVALNPRHPRKLASEEELLTLRPELIKIE